MLFCTCVGRFWPQNNKHIHTEGIKLGIIKTEYLILQGKNWRKQSKWLYCKIPFMRDIWIISERQSPIYLSQYLTNLMQKKICFKISFISCLYMFRAYVLIIRRSKLHYTASGIIKSIGGRLVHGLTEWIKLVKHWDKYTEMHGQQNFEKSCTFFATKILPTRFAM